MTDTNFRINNSDFSLKGDNPTRLRMKYRFTRNYHKTRAARNLDHLTRDEIKRSFELHLLNSPHLHN
jgi:hypothetical protein